MRDHLGDFRELKLELIANLPFGVSILHAPTDDPGDLTFLFFNDQAHIESGMNLLPLLGQKVRDVFPTGTEDPAVLAWMRAVRTGQPQLLEETPYGDDSHPSGWFRTHAVPLSDRHVASVYRNISPQSRRRRLRAVKRAAQVGPEQLQRLFDLSLDMMCIATLDGHFQSINPAFTAVLGHTTEALLAHPFLDFVHPEDIDATLREMARLQSGEDVVHFENRYQTSDDSWVWLSWKSVAVPEEGLVYAIARDVTRQKATEERLRQHTAELKRSNRELDQFAYVASHDLRAPLRDINNLASWLVEDLGDDLPPASRKHLDQILDRIERMDNLLEGLLAFSRLNQDRSPVTTFALADAVDAAFETLGTPPGFTLSSAVGDIPMLGHRVPLEQAIRNLVDNALKHHDQPTGSVRVRAEPRGEHVDILVEDDGPGIPARSRGRVLEIFQTLQPSSAGRSSGLGLSMVRKLAEQRGGSITIEAAQPRGCCVRLRWPLQDVP